MTWSPSPKLRSLLVLVGIGLVVGLATGRAEPVLLVAPIALVVAVGVAAAKPLELSIETNVDQRRVSEGDDVVVSVTITSPHELSRLEVAVVPPPGAEIREGRGARARGIAVAAGRSERVDVTLRFTRWGVHQADRVVVRARGPLGLLEAEGMQPAHTRVTVYPHRDTLRSLLAATRTQPAPGHHVARTRGSGIEFADTRAFVPGDRVRDVNWRVTARRNALWVNDRHPDRATDVVLFLDAFGGPTLPAAVRAAMSLSLAYLARRDRVGVVSFGSALRWLAPGSGIRQQYVIADTLLSTAAYESAAWRDVGIVPPRVLPPHALVIALTPLEDERSLAALVDLRSRGVDLVIVEVSPLPHVAATTDPAEQMGDRLWRLQREVLRDRYRAMGVPTIVWDESTPLAQAIEEMRAWPSRHRPAG